MWKSIHVVDAWLTCEPTANSRTSPPCPPITSSEAFMTHPICLICDVYGIDTMMGVPGWAGGFL